MKFFTLHLLTPLFSTGTDQARPEIRAPSIRGQLHWWFRALGGSYELEREVFGSVKGGARASRLVVRVGNIEMEEPRQIPTLPHKQGGPAAPKYAFPGGSFRLMIGQRLGPLSNDAQRMLDRTIQTWLLCGSLGLRSTRGGGAFQLKETPADPGAYLGSAQKLFAKAPLRIAVLSNAYDSAESARRDITDTLSHQVMRDLKYPLGAVRQGRNDPAPSRKTSPLRLTIRQFATGYHIIAVWDARKEVTRNEPDHLREAVRLLKVARKPLGEQLTKVIDQLTQ